MRLIKFTFLFFLVAFTGKAQTPSFSITPGGTTSVCAGTTVNINSSVTNGFPGTTAYTVANVPFAPYPMPTGTWVTMVDDTIRGPLPIGFQFCFFGNNYSQFYLGSNGWIGFSPGQTRAFTANSIPNTGMFVPRNCIMGPWMDWHPGVGTGPYIRYATQGTAPFRRLVVQWTNCPLYQCTGLNGTFQIVIHESTNIIENFITNKPICMAWAGGTATQGLHNQTGTVAVAVPGRNAAQWTATNDGKRFVPSGPTTFNVNWTANGAPIGTGNTVSHTVNTNTRIIGRATFPCSNLILYDTLDVLIGGGANASFTVPNAICAGQPATFNYSGGSAGTAAWTFTGATVPSGTGMPSQTATWNTPGTYPVSLTITPTSALCSPGTTTQNINVVAPPIAAINLPATRCIGQTASVSFAGSAPIGSTYAWNFGAGATPATATGIGPHNVSWGTTGAKTISLTVTSGACSATNTNTINITAAPTSTFTALPGTVCIGNNSTITFTGTAPVGATYTWNFGPGASPATATTVGPHLVNWSTSGSKNITLTVSNGGCSSALTTQTVNVNPAPVSAFSLPTSVCVGANASIAYTGTAPAPPGANYIWNLNGGTPAAGNTQGPFNASWATPGVKNITLVVSQGGCTSSPLTQSITVHAAPVVTVSANPTTVCLGQNSSLSISSGVLPAGTTYQWNFGAGASPLTSASAGPINVAWNSAGVKNPTLQVVSNGCTSAPASVNVTVQSPPIGTITLPASGCINNAVSISLANAYPVGTTFLWNFGGGTILSGTGAGPYSVSWPTSGLKNISVIISQGACSTTLNGTIDIKTNATASISAPLTGCVGQSALINFTGTASSTATYSWTFGIGATPATATGIGPHTVVWSSPGNKNIQVSVLDGGCPSVSATSSILIGNSATNTFTVSNPVCQGQTGTVTYTGNGNASSTYNWTFGAGATPATATGQGPHSVTWNTAGTSVVGLNVTFSGCSSGVGNQSITVTPQPTASFTLPATAGTGNPVSVQINGAPIAGATYSWNFGAGATPATAIGVGPHNVSWSTVGSKNVQLTVNLNGCVSTSMQSISIQNAPSASFILPTGVCVGSDAMITYNGNASPTANYVWNFGGGVIASGSGPGPYFISWNTAGIKTITLSVIENGISSVLNTQTLEVFSIPNSTFSLPTGTCTNEIVQAVYTGSASATASYTWNLPVGTSPTTVNGQGPHNLSWASQGVYPITLQVTQNGCVSLPTTRSITITAPIIADFSLPTQVCEQESAQVSLIGAATPGATYTWNFGTAANPASATGIGPHTIAWSTSGSKVVSLTVQMGTCTAAPINKVVEVHPIPQSSFDVLPNQCLNEPVELNYTGSSTGTASFLWNYSPADYVSGSGAGPLLINYSQNGDFQIELTVTENSCTSSSYEAIQISSPPVFSIQAPAVTGENTSIQVTYNGDQPTGLIPVWNFDGAQVISGSGYGPYQLSWPTSGNYLITCTLNTVGCGPQVVSSPVEVVSGPLASFQINSPICVGETSALTFNGFALPQSTFDWDFGGAQILNGTANGPFELLFPTAGNYTIVLNLAHLGQTSSFTQNVIVFDVPQPTIEIPSLICTNQTALIEAGGFLGTNPILLWMMDGDTLSNGSAQNIQPTFANAGISEIILEVVSQGCSSVVTQSLAISPTPELLFSTNQILCEGATEIVSYTGIASATNELHWQIDSGAVQTSSSEITLEWLTVGNYSLQVWAHDQGCNASIQTFNIQVNAIPQVSMNVPVDVCVGIPFELSAMGVFGPTATFNWNLDNLTSNPTNSSGPIELMANSSGSFTLQVSVTENQCTSPFVSTTINAIEPSLFAFNVSDTVYVGQSATAEFTGTTNNATSFDWTYPGADLLSGTAGGPLNIVWGQEGTYPVSLTIHPQACPSLSDTTFVVVIPIPSSQFVVDQSVCAESVLEITYSGVPNTAYTYAWDFSGATIISGSGAGPYFVSWADTGIQQVSLEVFDDTISSGLSTSLVHVLPVPVVSFSQPLSACPGTSTIAEFTGSAGPNAEYNWSVNGILQNETLAEIQFNWQNPGTYEIGLLVIDGMCAAGPSLQTLHVLGMPEVGIQASPYACLLDEYEVSYQGTANAESVFSWDFNGAEVLSGSGAGPYVLRWNNEGEKNIALIVQQNGCETDTAFMALTVRGLPLAHAGDDQLLCSGDTIVLGIDAIEGLSYTWLPAFGLNNDTISSPELSLNAIHAYADPTTYILNVTDGFCEAKDEVIVTLAPNPIASFEVPTPQCYDDHAFNFAAGGSYTDDAVFVWDFGTHANTHMPNQKNPTEITFNQGGYHTIGLIISQYGCSSEVFQDSILINSHPDASFSADVIKGCVPLTTNFSGNSNAGVGASYLWSFGDGNNAVGQQSQHTYTESGYMTVHVLVTDENGCNATSTQEQYIQVLELPEADFRAFPELVLLPDNELELTSLATNSLYCYYIIGNDTILGCTTAYNFTEPGLFPITQVVLNAMGCEDEITKYITVEYGSAFYIPSAFTPNDDGKNDVFKVIGEDIKQFSLTIFDRWGHIIFSTKNLEEGWDGTSVNNYPLPSGVYPYRLEIKSKKNKDFVENGSVTLIR